MITGLATLAGVGIQMFNSWQNNRQNSSLQAKREEFARAALENNKERMFQIMREGHEFTLQLEKENHQNRLKDLHTDFDRLLQKLAYSAAMDQWPLNVLPIVMKNQALGNLLAKQEEHIALHCIFTPSNCKEFNRQVFPVVESALEDFCNEHYSTLSKHPVLFYSGAWKTNDSPTGIQIDSMQSALANLPTLLISPFFRPTDHKLVIQIKLWGTGKKTDEFFSIPEIENNNFQRVYSVNGDYTCDEGLKNDIIEDLVPCLECVIGCISDTYFLSVLNLEPVLPSLINHGLVNTDGMKYIVRDVQDFYESLLKESEENSKLNLFNRCASIMIFSSLFPTWSDYEKKKRTEQLFLNYCSSRAAAPYNNVDDAVENYSWINEDFDFIDKFIGFVKQIGEEKKYKSYMLECFRNIFDPSSKLLTKCLYGFLGVLFVSASADVHEKQKPVFDKCFLLQEAKRKETFFEVQIELKFKVIQSVNGFYDIEILTSWGNSVHTINNYTLNKGNTITETFSFRKCTIDRFYIKGVFVDKKKLQVNTYVLNDGDFVDLGLSVKWSRFNLGAISPEDYGNYYAWGENFPKSVYTVENSKTYGREIEDIGGNTDYDATTVFLGNGIRLPRQNEFKELIENCAPKWTTHNGVKGILFISYINGNSIFLPATGYRIGASLYHVGDSGEYWSSTSFYNYDLLACCLFFDDTGYNDLGWFDRYSGKSVRPVQEF